MMDLRHLILGCGYRTIQLYRKVSGNNFRPDEIVWEICANTLVGEIDFPVLNRERWRLNGCGYVFRQEYTKGKVLHIQMAREILGLPRGSGHGDDEADHINHDTRDNRRMENLRVATSAQSKRNRRQEASALCRFKGIYRYRDGFMSRVMYNGERLYLGTFNVDTEAALAYFYATNSLDEEYFYNSEIPVNEMPSEARQEEIWQLVLSRLREAGFLETVRCVRG